ncbi:uncharacterized protein LOC131246501 isoform X2 [Magnolia sinica]|nr:uncharacterized protein LOC131246501 isoform X2 [Magnolia sinica]
MSTNKVVLLCRLGGEFIWESDNVYYKGGTNRIVRVERAINYLNLLCKVRGICMLTDITSIQYKYPGLDLDSLVSIENDDDISNMMDAFPQSNEPIQLFVLCAQNPSIPIAIPSNLMQNAGTGNAQPPLQDLHGGYKALASSSHNVDANKHDVPSASNGLINPVNNMQKVMPVLKEGQEFENANAFHEALREYAIRSNFQYRRTRSGHGRFQAKCIKYDCLWCIRACKVPDKPTFKIKFLKETHTCNAANEPTMSNTETHRQAGRKWIATLVKDRLRKNLDCTPKDIVDEISREYKIKVSYDKAWRGKELALKEMHFELSYPDLRMLCKDIEKTNPGSTTKLSRSSDNSLRLFIAYKAAICGFKKACRPVVRLERMKIEGEYPGEWFFARAIDATCIDFPLSYAFVELESIESWKWFCGELIQVLGSISGLTFISDRQEGILEETSWSLGCMA